MSEAEPHLAAGLEHERNSRFDQLSQRMRGALVKVLYSCRACTWVVCYKAPVPQQGFLGALSQECLSANRF